MFDKNKFAQILKKINETYDSQRDFSKKSEINRTYLSQYMNMKLDDPPKPKILEKLANASNNIINYEELMKVCGYIKGDDNDNILKLYTLLDNLENYYTNNNISLTQKEYEVEDALFEQFLKTTFSRRVSEKEIESSLNDIDYISERSKQKIKKNLINTLDYFWQKHKIESAIKTYKYSSTNNYQSRDKKRTIEYSKLFNIPLLGKIAAGQPLLAEEYLEGYLPIDPNIYGMTTPDDYFYLKVSGESMNLKIHNGDYALIHKQDYADDGDIIVAIVNGDDEATLKKYKHINESTIALEPMSTFPMEPIYINLKDTNFKIIGKAIGKFGKF